MTAGAYGLSFTGPHLPDRFIEAPAAWPTWRVDLDISDAVPPPEFWSDQRAVFWMRPAGTAVVDRPARSTRLVLPEQPPAEAFAHPFLGFTALAAAAWRGWPTFHAGAVVVNGRAWLVTGAVEAGKSSLLAWCALKGLGIVCDDVSIVSGGQVLAGPRCVDLREGAARRFGAGEDVGVLGSRRRWRIGLPGIAPCVPVAGWIRPTWAEESAVTVIPVDEQLRMMAAMRGMVSSHPDDAHLMALVAAPALNFARPRDFDQLDAAMDTLLAALDRY